MGGPEPTMRGYLPGWSRTAARSWRKTGSGHPRSRTVVTPHASRRSSTDKACASWWSASSVEEPRGPPAGKAKCTWASTSPGSTYRCRVAPGGRLPGRVTTSAIVPPAILMRTSCSNASDRPVKACSAYTWSSAASELGADSTTGPRDLHGRSRDAPASPLRHPRRRLGRWRRECVDAPSSRADAVR